jgi:hypothetical protein
VLFDALPASGFGSDDDGDGDGGGGYVGNSYDHATCGIRCASGSSSDSGGSSIDSVGDGGRLRSGPRSADPPGRVATWRPSSVASALAATGSFSAAAVQGADAAVLAARARRRSLAALFAPPTAAAAAAATTAAAATGDAQAEAARDARQRRADGRSGGVWAVVCTRPLRWAAAGAGSGGWEWTLVEVGAPLVLHNGHSEPLLVALRQRTKAPAEVAPANAAPDPSAGLVDDGAAAASVPNVPRRFGRPAPLRVPLAGPSPLPPPPPPRVPEPLTPPPSPALLAVDAARGRLAAKLSKVSSQLQTQKQPLEGGSGEGTKDAKDSKDPLAPTDGAHVSVPGATLDML